MDHMQVLSTLKNILKAKGLTYKDLATSLHMSESGVKKLLSNSDISLKRLSQMSQILGIELLDLMKLAGEQEVKSVRLAPKQEQALFQNSNLLRVFWFLAIEERSLDEIRRIEKLNKNQIEVLLLRLENLDLIRRNSNGDVISFHKGLYRWVGDSPGLQKLHRDWSNNLLKKVLKNKESPEKLYRLSFMKFNKKTREEFFKRLTELTDDFARRSQREKLESSTNQLIPISLLFAIDSSGFLDPLE